MARKKQKSENKKTERNNTTKQLDHDYQRAKYPSKTRNKHQLNKTPNNNKNLLVLFCSKCSSRYKLESCQWKPFEFCQISVEILSNVCRPNHLEECCKFGPNWTSSILCAILLWLKCNLHTGEMWSPICSCKVYRLGHDCHYQIGEAIPMCFRHCLRVFWSLGGFHRSGSVFCVDWLLLEFCDISAWKPKNGMFSLP